MNPIVQKVAVRLGEHSELSRGTFENKLWESLTGGISFL
jgi:hypothetical protein